MHFFYSEMAHWSTFGLHIWLSWAITPADVRLCCDLHLCGNFVTRLINSSYDSVTLDTINQPCNVLLGSPSNAYGVLSKILFQIWSVCWTATKFRPIFVAFPFLPSACLCDWTACKWNEVILLPPRRPVSHYRFFLWWLRSLQSLTLQHFHHPRQMFLS